MTLVKGGTDRDTFPYNLGWSVSGRNIFIIQDKNQYQSIWSLAVKTAATQTKVHLSGLKINIILQPTEVGFVCVAATLVAGALGL